MTQNRKEVYDVTKNLDEAIQRANTYAIKNARDDEQRGEVCEWMEKASELALQYREMVRRFVK